MNAEITETNQKESTSGLAWLLGIVVIISLIMAYKHIFVILSVIKGFQWSWFKTSYVFVTVFSLYLGIFLFLWQRKWKFVWINFFICLNTFILITIYFYYRYFKALPHVWLVNQLGMADMIAPVMVSQMLTLSDLRFIIDFLVFNTCYLLMTRRAKSFYDRAIRKITLSSFAVFIVLFGFHWGKNVIGSDTTILISDWSEIDAFSIYGISSIWYKDIKEGIGSFLEEEECENQINPVKHGPSYPGYGRYNFIMIQVESLDFNVINRRFEGKEITPNLNRLAKENTFFVNFYPYHVSGTSDAEFTALNSLLPLRISVLMRYPFMDYPSIPRKLKGEGYASVIMHANNGFVWNRNVALKAMGFDRFHDAKSFYKGSRRSWIGILDEDFFDKSFGIIKSLKQPFFAYLITLTSHGPFKLRDEYARADFNVNSKIVRNYFRTINYVDYAIGRFVRTVTESPLKNNTVIFIFGDHNADIEESVYTSYDTSGGDYQDSEKFGRIPLIIIFPEAQHRIIDKYGSTVDIPPTVFDILGLDIPSEWVGQSLLRDDRDGYVVENTSPPYVINREGLWRFVDGQFRHTETGALLADPGYYLDIIRYSECKIKGKIQVN